MAVRSRDEHEDTARILVEALPYIRRFAGKVVVVKFGGNALDAQDPERALALFAQDVVLMHSVGIKPVVVHGGGPQIDEMLSRLGIGTSFVDGVRVTDDAAMDVVRMVLVGQVNPRIVSAINAHGALAAGVSGEDGRMIRAKALGPDSGRTGRVESVDTSLLDALHRDGMIPVVATVGIDGSGEAYNINADSVAGALAGALRAEKAVFLTDVEGLRGDPDDPSTLLSSVTVDDLRGLAAKGALGGGMIPKAQACITAIEAGARTAHILDGRREHVLLLELFTDAGVGTMVTAGARNGQP